MKDRWAPCPELDLVLEMGVLGRGGRENKVYEVDDGVGDGLWVVHFNLIMGELLH